MPLKMLALQTLGHKSYYGLRSEYTKIGFHTIQLNNHSKVIPFQAAVILLV